MLKALGLIFLSLLFGGAVVGLSAAMGSDFPVTFALNSSIEVMGTILALNVASATFLIGSLLSLEEKTGDNTIFKGPRKEIRQNIVAMAALFVLNVFLVACINGVKLELGLNGTTVFSGLVFSALFFQLYLLLEIVFATFSIHNPAKKK